MTLSTTRSATAERSFYLIVRGGGSWGGGDPFRTYRAGAHEVSAEVAEAVLVFKEKHPKASWLVLSDVRPELEDGSLVSLLLPEHVQPGAMPDGVRLLREDEQADSGPGNEKNGAEAPPLVYACHFCPARFPSAAAAKRHLRHNQSSSLRRSRPASGPNSKPSASSAPRAVRAGCCRRRRPARHRESSCSITSSEA